MIKKRFYGQGSVTFTLIDPDYGRSPSNANEYFLVIDLGSPYASINEGPECDLFTIRFLGDWEYAWLDRLMAGSLVNEVLLDGPDEYVRRTKGE